MMNVVALCLVLSSLVTAGVWSPTPNEDVKVKNGHQVVVVEFDKEDGNTKVSISPQEAAHKPPPGVVLDDRCCVTGTRDKLSTVAKEATEEAREAAASASNGGPGEVLKEKVASVLDKAKDAEERAKEAVSEAFRKVKEETKEKVLDKAEGAKDTVSDFSEKAKETVTEKAYGVKDVAGDILQKAKETLSEKAEIVKETVTEKAQKAKQTVSEKAQKVEELAEEMAEKAKHGAKTVLDTSKTMGKDVERNVGTTIESIKEKAREAAQTEGGGGGTATVDLVEEEKGEKDLNEILRRGGEVVYDVIVYVVSPLAVEPAAGVVHLLGFAAAFGMCLWVTFVSSYVLAGVLSTQQFGVLQSKIYPVYFRIMAYSVALALVAHLVGLRKRMLANHMAVEVFLAYNLVAALLMVLFNLLYLEPRATKVMFERMKVEKEEGRGLDIPISETTSKAAADPAAATPAVPAAAADATSAPRVILPEKLDHEQAAKARLVELSERLKKLNAYSSLLNILTLVLLTWHLVYLGQHLHMTC